MGLDPELLAEVLARPEDDAPRLVLADKLTEGGDPRGELIVVQCLLAGKGLSPARRRQLQRRSDELVVKAKAWFENAKNLSRHVVRRGFIDEIQSEAKKLVPIAKKLFSEEPITRLKLTNTNANVLGELAKADAFARVLRLTIVGNIGDAGATTLAMALATRKRPLESLNVGATGIESEGAVALASALKGCRSLALTGNEIGDEGLTAIATSKALASLEALYITDNGVTDDGVLALAKGSLAKLERLSLARNDEVTPNALAALAKSKKLRSLKWLEYPDEDEGQRVAVRKR